MAKKTDTIFVKRYAKKIFNIALKEKGFSEWRRDVSRVAYLLKDEALFAFLKDPEIGSEKKAKVVGERLLCEKPLCMKLVCELIHKGRLGAFVDIAYEFQLLVDNYHGMEGVLAEITTAVPLDDEHKIEIAERLTGLFGRTVVLKPKVDPDLIGGIIIRVGDKLIDGSIRSKLEALKKELV